MFPKYTLLASFSAITCSGFAQEVPRDPPAGFGQLETPPAMIPGGTDQTGHEYSYLGQPAKNEKLVLTASNGFFTKGVCRAAGESDLPKIGDEDLIQPNFAYLENWSDTDGTIRWHVHVADAGAVRLQTFLEVGRAASGSQVEIKFGELTQVVTTGVSDGKTPQDWDVVFEIAEPGEYEISFRAVQIANEKDGVGKLHRAEVFGPAVADSSLLRARWRPAAVHGGYDSSKVNEGRLLVTTTRSTVPISNYSPITTPFGYYGTSFTGEKKSNGEFNFSMWGKDGAASDLKQMPHLLGVGSPEGEFSGFGHEGSGVKPRGWTPMPDQPGLCVQALRVDPGELYDTYCGYYFDHPTEAWKFYGAGKKWHDGKPNPHLKVGSFCEVPGPPQVERTGDIYREVRRRGWYRDGDEWVVMDQYLPSGNGSKGDLPVNKRWFLTDEGEYAMGCGGIRYYTASDPPAPSGNDELPYFLASESVANLFTLPIEFGSIDTTELAGNSAIIDVNIANGANLKGGTVYYGTKDALTFAPRDLHGTEKNSELSQSVNESSWQSSSKFETAKVGANRVVLTGLEPDTTYFYRVLIDNDVSRIWNNETLTFTTPQAGSTPAMTTEKPFRTWTYTVSGAEKKIEGRLVKASGDEVVIERKADGKTGALPVEMLSAADRDYLTGKR
jgi:hypothetical protein